MLKIVQIQSPSQIEELFASFNPQTQSWVVSDLRTKLEMQKVLIERQGYFLDSAVLRASDLWKQLLKRLAPELRIVSKDFARSLLRSFVDKNASVFNINSTSEKSLFNYMTQLAPLALAQDSDEQISKWFSDHPEISMRWQSWYLIARSSLRWMIQEKKVIIADWIPSYLQEIDGLETAWEQDIIVDLGSEVSTVEAEVFQRLSHRQNITVIEPRPTWREEFHYLLQPYEYLRPQAQEVIALKSPLLPPAVKESLRLSGMLAEVKHSCSQIRQWLEKGVAASQIAVIAPDIEMYWPVLSAYLEQEGIPFQKDLTVKLQGLPSLQQWVATLRAQSSRVTSADLEVSFYSRQEAQSLRYEEFAALFKAIYGEEDLAREEKVHKLYHSEISLDENLNRDQFLSQALKAWPRREGPTEMLIVVLREVFQNAASQVELSYKEWLTYLENILANKEMKAVSGSTEGLVITPLMSAQSYKMSYKIFLGLCDENLKNRQRSHILGADLNRLALDLGFYLEHPDHSFKEFQLRWLAEGPGEKNVFSFGLSDFSGTLLSPSNFWMSLKPSDALTVPGNTRWDALQCVEDAKILEIRGRGNDEQALLLERLQMDRGQKILPSLDLKQVPSLSASQIERYLECPFVFAAQKVFKLQDHPDLDLDEDARSKGTLAHALFEKLTYPEFRAEITDVEMDAVLEELRIQEKITLADPRLWASMKRRYLALGRRFVNFEKEWRREFPDTLTIAAEKDFVFYFNPQNGEVHREALEGTLKFSGKIDRIDRHRQNSNHVVIDYKSSHAAYKNHSAWFENRELQLLFYMWALEKELLSEITGEVVGAFYYSFKDFHREKGFQIEDHAGPLFRPAGRKGVKASGEDKKELLTQFEGLILEVVGKIQKGEIDPRPFDVKTCDSCEWSVLCRAPHRN
ncbi:PD-(D/E)XK nuclease family protein [Bdellovibrio sp. HCB337]|uniref:PD-(D/E)XK nuclease family protein n=1 Tax=Bdellovibrio sp. HCB337 TaxID=3394358 RepID=UPI0039A50859